MYKIALLVVGLSVSLMGAALAAPITRIDVQGQGRVEADTVLAYLPFKVGDEFDTVDTAQVIASLFATGLFANVSIKQADGVVQVEVVENPMVNRVVFEGNDDLDSKRLEEIVSLKPRAIYSPAKVQADVQSLQAAYRQRGRFNTSVRAQLIERDQNRVDVIYNVTEGETSSIRKVTFVGNEKFSDSDLNEVVATKRTAWWRFLSSADTYDPARIEVDQDLLRRFYLSRGFADVQVTSGVAELTKDRKDFVITYTIFEGPKYDFGAINVALQAEAEGLDVAALQKAVTLQPGELFNAERVERNTDTLIDALGSKGFAFLNVAPQYSKDEANRTVAVTYAINPGPRVYVNKINIEGNTRTRDYVVRRELRLAEGDAFSAEKVKRSRDRVQYLGYFDKVDITRAETTDPDRLDLNVKVSEQSTGEFNIGAGYSTFDGLLATADVRERNFMGKGQEVAVKFAVSQRQQNFNVGFTEPYFLGRELAAGVDLFNEKTDFQSESSYNVDNSGGALRLGFPVSEFVRNSTKLGYKNTKIANVGASASQFVKREAGQRDSLFLSDTLSFDNRDSQLLPTRGYRVAATAEYSGFGSGVNYMRGLLTGSYHHSLADDWVLSLGGRAGAVHDFGEDLPIYEHFMGGGAQLRGFEYGGIGPRDAATGDALGGMYMVGNSAELSFPLTSGLKELGMQGLVFMDGGMITEFEGANSGVTDSQLYRVSAGTGVFWRSPIGPLRVEFAIPVVKASEDRKQIFSFSVGSRF
jgi:outer membrane protein insertion porin family